ncbi:winged helix-turn-helix domain-containing protein [Methanothrix soehngenii]|uniref:winged helix-turn-helix domain-containing protein n=1 Tax=Methanothrix soehngenii TaxID=2223 RepID=UPI0023F10489|nr:winged helix-turn-helix transcriptional regulator [Methanothrix soehngenii]
MAGLKQPKLNVNRLPPSAKLVIKVLESDGLLTQKDIINKTYLPARTVRYALRRLREEKLIQERFYFQDARQSLYGLNAQAREAITA